MTATFVVGRQVIAEAARRKLLLALVLLTIVVIALTVWGIARIEDLRSAGQPLSEAQRRTIVSFSAKARLRPSGEMAIRGA